MTSSRASEHEKAGREAERESEKDRLEAEREWEKDRREAARERARMRASETEVIAQADPKLPAR